VYNVKALKFDKFEYTCQNEHSKWGISDKSDIICIGDLNRCDSQKKRGGMIACFEDSNLKKEFKNAITDYEKCKNKTLSFLSN